MARARVALGQFHAIADKETNLQRMLALHQEAATAGADLVVFPEMAMYTDDDPRAEFGGVAESLDGPFVQRLREGAARRGTGIVAGMYETAPGDGAKTYNTAVAIGTDGGLIGAYRKIHMFDAFGFRESDQNQPGDGELLLFTLAGVRFGVTICYDLRFPELFRALAERGAEALLLPTAWAHGRLKELQLSTLSRARAIENTVYFAAADQTGGSVSGNSELIDPMGVTVASIGEAEGLAIGVVDTERVVEVRRRVPSLQHVRHDIYDTWRRVPEPV